MRVSHIVIDCMPALRHRLAISAASLCGEGAVLDAAGVMWEDTKFAEEEEEAGTRRTTRKTDVGADEQQRALELLDVPVRETHQAASSLWL